MTVIICDEIRADEGDLVSEELRNTIALMQLVFSTILEPFHLLSLRLVKYDGYSFSQVSKQLLIIMISTCH